MALQFPQRLRSLPTPIGGLALGIASVSWCADGVLGLGGLLQSLGALVAAGLLALLAARAFLHFDTILADVRHPVAGSILPTAAMCLMVLSRAVGRFSPGAGEALWFFAVALHIVVLLGFTFFRLREANFEAMVPSWFIPPVGIIVADVTFPGVTALLPLAQGCLFVGLTSYAVMLPVMLCRLILGSRIAEGVRPTLAILAAPASLSLAGYLTVAEKPDLLLATLLLGIALLMTLVIYFAFWNLLRLRFSPGYAAYTFPMAIGATALYRFSDVFASVPEIAEHVGFLRALAHVELSVALIVITYVFVLYVKHLPKLLVKA